jgi:DNA-directed RNA polymerase specialized sigma24 family protein
VRLVALRNSLSPDDLLDLRQEVSLALLRAGPSHEINASWVFHTAQHKVVDLKRQIQIGKLDFDPSPRFSSGEPDPELLHLLRARAATLPAPLREFYSLRYEQGLSQRETARHMGAGRKSIRLMDARCLHFLMDQLHD